MKNKETLEKAAEKYVENFAMSVKSARQIGFIDGAKWQQEKSYSEEEVNKMFDTLKRNSVDNVATIHNVDLFISSWKQEFKKK
jgi:hypothetical protein